jgi:ATP-dependent DNA helicase RecG
VRDACAGRQAYWVCPLIEESRTALQLQAALATCESCDTASLSRASRVGLVHGRLKAAEKAR